MQKKRRIWILLFNAISTIFQLYCGMEKNQKQNKDKTKQKRKSFDKNKQTNKTNKTKQINKINHYGHVTKEHEFVLISPPPKKNKPSTRKLYQNKYLGDNCIVFENFTASI